MDDLEFIKRDVQKHLNEGMVFNDCGAMVKSMLSELVEAHLEAEAEDPDSGITDTLANLVRMYGSARIR